MTVSDTLGDVLLVAAFFMLGAEVVRQTEGPSPRGLEARADSLGRLLDARILSVASSTRVEEAPPAKSNGSNSGWAFLDAIYFWCITVSTVGFGDLSPATPAGKAFVSVWAPLGMVVVFSVVAKWASAVQSGLQAFYVRAMGLVGFYVLDVESMSIAEHTPDQVNERIR